MTCPALLSFHVPEVSEYLPTTVASVPSSTPLTIDITIPAKASAAEGSIKLRVESLEMFLELCRHLERDSEPSLAVVGDSARGRGRTGKCGIRRVVVGISPSMNGDFQ